LCDGLRILCRLGVIQAHADPIAIGKLDAPSLKFRLNLLAVSLVGLKLAELEIQNRALAYTSSLRQFDLS
jgi:hypothetical protein